MPLKRTPRKLAARLLLYLGIALAALALCAFAAWVFIATGTNPPASRWGAFAVFTPFVFWFVARQCRRYWRRLSFWLTAAALLAAHVGLFAFVLTRYPEWPPVWFAPVSIVEIGLLILVLDKLLGGGHSRLRRNHRQSERSH